MGENTAIEWADHTFNPWSGCTKVSPGCANCYAEKLGGRFPHLGNWGPGAERKRTGESNWRKPLAWAKGGQSRNCEACSGYLSPRWDCGSCRGKGVVRPRVFCASLADWLDPEVPAEWLAELLALIAATPELDWLLLTKRPQLWELRLLAVRDLLRLRGDCQIVLAWVEAWLDHFRPPANVWVGTSVEDQQRADERIPHLIEIPARVRFLSCEPLLGPVDLRQWLCFAGCWNGGHQRFGNTCVNWVIAGGESGQGARPMHPDWARSLRDQCQEAGAAFHFKQWGAFAQSEDREPGDSWLWADGGETSDGEAGRVPPGHPVNMRRVGKKAAGRLLDGRTWDEVPRA